MPPAPHTSPPLVPPRKGGQREGESHVELGSNTAWPSWAGRSWIFHLQDGLYLSPPAVTGRVKRGAWLGTLTRSPSSDQCPLGSSTAASAMDCGGQTGPNACPHGASTGRGWPHPRTHSRCCWGPVGWHRPGQARAWRAGDATVEEGLSDKVPGEQKTETLMRKAKISAWNVPPWGVRGDGARTFTAHRRIKTGNQWKTWTQDGADSTVAFSRSSWLTSHSPDPGPHSVLSASMYQRAGPSRQASEEVRSIIYHRQGNVQVANEGVRAVY